MTNLDTVSTIVRDASAPEAVFGSLSGTTDKQLRDLTTQYKRLATMLHPDRFTDAREQAEATTIFARLTALRTEAEYAIRAGNYGKPRAPIAAPAGPNLPVTVATKSAEYHLAELVARGDVADVYGCEVVAVSDLATRFRVFASPFCTTVDSETTELLYEVEAAIRERDLLRAKVARLRLRTLGVDGPPNMWPVVLFLEKSSEWANRVVECVGLDGRNWKVGSGRWISIKTKPTDRYLPVAALLEEP